MEKNGYKAFDKNITNNYGMKFELGKKYTVDGKASFGVTGNGYHFALRMEDTFRYLGGLENDNIVIAEVTGLDEIVEFEDNYNGYYDMYCAKSLIVNRIVPRMEIIKYFLDCSPYRVVRFVSGYKLTKFEIELFKIKFSNSIDVIDTIAYYQEGDLDVYKRRIKGYIKDR